MRKFLNVQKLSPTGSPVSCTQVSEMGSELGGDELGLQELSFQLSKSSVSVSQDRNLFGSFKSPSKAQKSFLNLNKTISDNSIIQTLNIEEMPTDPVNHSEALPVHEIFEECKENQILFTSFATPNKVFCSACDKDVYSFVKTKESRRREWGSLSELLTTFICCEPKSGGQKEMWHYCGKCNKVLAKVVSKL